MEKSKQNECIVGDKDNGIGDNVENSDDNADKHLTYPSQVVDCHSTERSKQNMRDVGNKDDDVDNSVDN
eukprot:9203509-Ditylum_brightwellii.AAC.1